MATFTKAKLSGSTDGLPIKLVATSTPGTAIHTAVAGTTEGTFDEIWLWAQNNHTSDVVLTLEWGGTTSPDHLIIITLEYKAGLIPVVPGFILQNEKAVKAFANQANVVMLYGFVNKITV